MFFSFLFNHTFHRAEATAATAECKKLRFLFHRYARLAPHVPVCVFHFTLSIFPSSKPRVQVLPRIVWAHLCFRTGRFISAKEATSGMKCDRRVYPDWAWEATVEAKVFLVFFAAREILKEKEGACGIFYFSSFINFMTGQEGHICDFKGPWLYRWRPHTHEAPLTSCSDKRKKKTQHMA